MEVLGANTGTSTGYATFVYEPVYVPPPVADNTWQSWDAYRSGNAIWWSTRTISVGRRAGRLQPERHLAALREQVYVPWSVLVAANPGATVLSYGVNQGTGSPGLIDNTDALSIGVNGTVGSTTSSAARPRATARRTARPARSPSTTAPFRRRAGASRPYGGATGGSSGCAERLDHDRGQDDPAADQRGRARLFAQGDPDPQRAEHDLEQGDQRHLGGRDQARADRQEDQAEADLGHAEAGEQRQVFRADLRGRRERRRAHEDRAPARARSPAPSRPGAGGG